MAKARLKTRPGKGSVQRFLSAIKDKNTRSDCATVIKIMRFATGETPVMWGTSIVGFGTYHYKYKSGLEGDWFLTGFSPRKQNLTLYIMAGFRSHADLLKKLGKYKLASSCLYLKSLDDVNLNVLKALIRRSIVELKRLSTP